MIVRATLFDKLKEIVNNLLELFDQTVTEVLLYGSPNLKGNQNSQILECTQGSSEGTSSVAFKVLTINCQMYFTNLFIFDCSTLNIKLLIFKLFDIKFLSSKNRVFRKQKRTAFYGVMDARP